MNLHPTEIKLLLSQSLTQKFITERLFRFLDDVGIRKILSFMNRFSMDEVIGALQQKLGYKLQDRTRLRMVKAIIDLLYECEYLEKQEGCYLWKGNNWLEERLQKHELEIVKYSFEGQIDFFEKCISYANKFLRGNSTFYNFDNSSIYVWEDFLGNAEFTYGRSVLINLLFSDKSNGLKVLDLCPGPGFDILQMQKHSPDIILTALDFKDIFKSRASRRIPNTDTVEWIDSTLWKGFGTPLPFENDTFDIVFFACADPYIPVELREYVYRDIFRVLKRAGALGILTNSYPDIARKYVKEKWVRRGILCHDFSESVCEGWHGFYDPQESVNLFKTIGYHINTLMLNASVWRLDKP